MDFKIKLSERIRMDDINEIIRLIENDDKQKQHLYDLITGEDDSIGYQAAWIFTHLSRKENKWLYNKQDELIKEVLCCKHGGKRRLILNLLYKQPMPNPPRVDFLDFCLERMLSSAELPGVQSVCMKIAYELCRPIPELAQELKTALEMMEGNLCPAILSSKNKVLKAMQKGKSLQRY